MDREMTQDEYFDLYCHMARHSSYAQVGIFDIYELANHYPENEVMEMLLVYFGHSPITWDYGHWKIWRDRLITVFGDKLIPYAERRMKNPFHGGGTAYGDAYLAHCKALTSAFCQVVLNKLKEDKDDLPALPVWRVRHKPTDQIVFQSTNEAEAQNMRLYGQLEIPEKYNRWRSFEYEVIGNGS